MYKISIPILFTIFCTFQSYGMKVFDMKEIRDPNTLEVRVLQDWHKVEGVIETRQKLVSINVGDIWPSQEYRVPVRMVVPANRKAKGFHLTGSSNPKRLENDTRPDSTERELLKGGVGLVITVVQEPGTYGQRKLSMESEQRFAKSLNPRFKIQYWAWPATLMRAITTAYSEKEHFEKGKVAASGGSKNGASPSMAIIHDDRMTAVHATVSPIWDSPFDSMMKRLGRNSGINLVEEVDSPAAISDPILISECSMREGHGRICKISPAIYPIKYSYPAI